MNSSMMPNDEGVKKIVTHDFPAWREKANFIIGVNLTQPGISDLATSEQIWARQIADNIFEICCIPFFAYGLALGDYVRTRNEGNDKYLIDEVIERRGHTTYRIWLASAEDWAETIDEIAGLGCLVEVRWEKSRLLAVDAPTSESKMKLEEFLTGLEKEQKAQVEIGVWGKNGARPPLLT